MCGVLLNSIPEVVLPGLVVGGDVVLNSTPGIVLPGFLGDTIGGGVVLNPFLEVVLNPRLVVPNSDVVLR